MKKYEVQILVTATPGGILGAYADANRCKDGLARTINIYGEEGFELVSVVTYRNVIQHYFRREIEG